MNPPEMKRCSRCVEPEIAPNIQFDDEGVCNYCRSHRPYTYKGEDALIRLLKETKGKGAKYDAIVMVSGGRDSTYVLLKLVKDYGVRVLAVNYENPFTDPQAIKNIENAVRILGVDLVRIPDRNHRHVRTFRNNILAWFRHPSPAMIPIVCIGCKTMWRSVIQIAREHGISCIVSGGNPYEEISFKKELVKVSGEVERRNKFRKAFSGIFRESLRNLRYYHPTCLPTLVEAFLFANEHCLGSRLLGFQMKRIQLFDYIPWREEEVLLRIRNELQWDSPHHLHSTWRFDCRVAHVRDYMYETSLHMQEREDLYSKMVREGEMTREEALRRVKEENQLYREEVLNVLRIAGIEHPESFLQDS